MHMTWRYVTYASKVFSVERGEGEEEEQGKFHPSSLY